MSIPYPLVWGHGNLEICVEDKVFKVHFERRFRQAGDSAVFGSSIISVKNLELRQDRTGSVSYTELTIQFPMYVMYDTTSREELYGWVLEVVNRLLEVYRYATGDFYVSNIPKRELFVQRIRKT